MVIVFYFYLTRKYKSILSDLWDKLVENGFFDLVVETHVSSGFSNNMR
jgi:hypothetical protein